MRRPGLTFVFAWALVCAAWPSPAFAGPDRGDGTHTVWYRSLGVEHGLSRSFVTAMAADHDGFMWFGTLAGLNRWDGYRFETFTPDPSIPNSLSSAIIVALHAATDGGLWIGTPDGVHRFDPSTRGFRRFRPADGRVVLSDRLTSDLHGRVWVTAFGGSRLHVIDPREGSWQLVPLPHIGTLRVSAIHVDARNRLWVALLPVVAFDSTVDVESRVIAFDLNGSPGPLLAPPVIETTGGRVEAFVEDRSGRVWFARPGGGLQRFDPGTGETRSIDTSTGDGAALQTRRVHSMVLGPSRHHVWALALPRDGDALLDPRRLYRIDPDTLEARQVVLREREPGPTGDSPLERLATDPSGVLWMATNGGGLRYADVSVRGFELFRDTSGTGGVNANFVRAVVRDRNGIVWVGTPRGLNRIDRHTGTNAPTSIPLPHPYVQTLHEDRLGNLWVGTNGGLVVKYRSGGPPRLFLHDANDPRSLGEDFVQVIRETPDGRMWFGTLGGGIDEYDVRHRAFTHHRANPSDGTGLPSNEVNALHVSAAHLWIGTSAGLARANIAAGAATRIEHVAPASAELGRTHVLSLGDSPAHPGALWIGTERQGLCRLTIATNEVHCLNTRNSGLPDNTVYGILPDRRGRLWLSTNRGISVYDPNTAAFRTYDSDASLQSREFNARAHFGAPDGELFFGGVSGLNAFYPDQLSGNPNAPRVFVTAVAASGRSDGAARATPTIVHRHGMARGDTTLTFEQREVTFDFVALHFSDPPSLRYAYHLDGYDTAWQGPATTRSVRYTNLPPGRYTFRVRAVSSDGIFSREDATFGFGVLPPFYATTWFRSLALASLVVALTIGYQLRVRGLRRQRASLEQQVARRTDELQQAADTLTRQAEQLKALDATKSRFFANISHEFRTPLTLTLGPLRDVSAGMHGEVPPEARHEIERAIGHTERQLTLVEQLLELARLDSGRLTFAPKPIRLDAVIRVAAAHFESHTKRQAIRFVVALPDAAVHSLGEEERLERVVTNLLDNAFKFTPPGGTVVLSVTRDGDSASIAVDDTGPGIPADDLPHLFERFYRAARDSEHVPGTGIGLALAKEYVELHGGTITAENRPGGGARFTVRLHARFVDEPASTPPPVTDTSDTDDTSAPTAAPAVEERADTGPATVLVVDDHPDIRAYVRKHLEPHYRVVEAARGDEGLIVVRAELPDVIVCDVMMPGLDGFAFCRAVKADPETDFLPVILLTAKAGTEGRLEGLEGGADDYLTKPFVPAELLARIRNLITARERLRMRLGAQPPAPLRLALPRPTPSVDDVLLGRLRGVLETSAHDEDFDVPALAAGVGMSRAQLHRRLREAFQMTPAGMIIRYRLERAAQMLGDRAGNVSEVAYAVGFKNVSHFVKRFREHYGQTPASWAAPSEDRTP